MLSVLAWYPPKTRSFPDDTVRWLTDAKPAHYTETIPKRGVHAAVYAAKAPVV
jgi:hypothetical protein